MQKTPAVVRTALVFTFLTLLLGCRAGDLAATAGHYQGLLSEKQSARTAQTPISADQTAPANFRLELKVATVEARPRSWQFRVGAAIRGQATVTDLTPGLSTPVAPT